MQKKNKPEANKAAEPRFWLGWWQGTHRRDMIKTNFPQPSDCN